MPIAPNNLLNVDVPVSQLANTKVGDVVQGQVSTALGLVSWTGAITAGTTVSPTQGCVTVKVISDKYIAPGTQVSGSVGNAAFVGTVVGSPNHQERMGNIERRLKALEPDHKEEVLLLRSRLKKLGKELRRLEGHKTVAERMEALEKQIIELEKNPPAEDTATFSGNIAGMHFVGGVSPIGRNGLSQRMDRIEDRLSKIEQRPTPKDYMKPAEERLAGLEARVAALTRDGGLVKAKQQMAAMERDLARLERRYGGDAGGNSKWYGTRRYHGLDRDPEPLDTDRAPSGSF
eukprot:CAMPEP_0172175392 /NCGR_PEP_ID=MMETSP1050-20130122/14200_1 /TAXON_ID=233186 /ORGANISM="Cryptomonas curvata, Strain CCAP979/52" /LENGTH=288 /DNA_ID=CAMNT_0012847485 /DNA_START=158 /DNA_END=1024 /DNA_ORIENTATION=+